MKTNKQEKIKTPVGAYIGYLFQTFLKRPFGYIVAALYIIYLAVILLIVPASLHFEPLFIWNVAGFNMAIFNLFFIGGAAASIAVAVFRTGRDDGFDLNMSAKPITKGTTVWLKTLVYVLIMLIVNVVTLLIVLLIYPVFGEYNAVTNSTGITKDKYFAMIASMFIGNLINMLFFGGISVFISMIGGQVITIIGTVSIVFVMCLMNFIYPQILNSATDILSEKYDTEILSYSCNTLHQYNTSEPNAHPFNFATIQCVTNDLGAEDNHYDTKEYWDRAEAEAGRKLANYIDIAKQLSSLYSLQGLDESKIKEASKLVIGTNNAYNYNIDETTHVTTQENLEQEKYPVGIYAMTNSQGKSFPYVRILGGNMTLTTSNWYLLTTLWQINFDSIAYLSTENDSMNISEKMWKVYETPWNFMYDLYLTNEQKQASKHLYQNAIQNWEPDKTDKNKFSNYCLEKIQQDQSGVFFEVGKFNDLPPQQKHRIITMNHLYWAILAQQNQVEEIKDWARRKEIDGVSFPFSSKLISQWYAEDVDPNDSAYGPTNDFNLHVFGNAIKVEHFEDDNTDSYSRLVTTTMKYVETFSNMYQYTVSNFYNLSVIITIWTAISLALFAGSILVYKKTDFK